MKKRGSKPGERRGGRSKGTLNINKDSALKGVYTDLIGSFKSGKFYVYYHIDSLTQTVFYIGKGSGNRAWGKLNRNELWIDYASRSGYEVKIICANMSEQEALSIERILIDINQPLCNLNHTNIFYAV